MDRPFSPSSERNRAPIEQVLRHAFADRHNVLEIGSGTGQHACYFSETFPHLSWQCSDRAEYLPGIRSWRSHAQLANMPEPIELDVNQAIWPDGKFDAVFTANTLHIMAWEEVQQLFARLPEVLGPDARLVVYGPFKFGGSHTSQSNAAFDARLKSDDPVRGIRDFEAVEALAHAAGLELQGHHHMPANNRCLVWSRAGSRPGAAGR